MNKKEEEETFCNSCCTAATSVSMEAILADFKNQGKRGSSRCSTKWVAPTSDVELLLTEGSTPFFQTLSVGSLLDGCEKYCSRGTKETFHQARPGKTRGVRGVRGVGGVGGRTPCSLVADMKDLSRLAIFDQRK